MSTTKQAEELLQKLRRLPANKTCANCGTSSRLGFSAVCMKFSTFVCDNCKSAHQGFSHLCKSVTMSHWTMDEVRALERGGGNAVCQKKWFGKMTAADRSRYVPREGSVILEEYKRLVQAAYEEKRWLDLNFEATANAAPIEVVAAAAPIKSKPQVKAAVSAAAPVTVDLLDFSDEFVSAPPAAASQQSAFQFIQQPPAPTSSFQFIQQPPAPTSSFQFIQQPPTSFVQFIQPPPQQQFAPMMQQQQQQPFTPMMQQQKPSTFEDPFAHLSVAPQRPPPPQQQPQQQQFQKPIVASGLPSNDPFAGLF